MDFFQYKGCRGKFQGNAWPCSLDGMTRFRYQDSAVHSRPLSHKNWKTSHKVNPEGLSVEAKECQVAPAPASCDAYVKHGNSAKCVQRNVDGIESGNEKEAFKYHRGFQPGSADSMPWESPRRVSDISIGYADRTVSKRSHVLPTTVGRANKTKNQDSPNKPGRPSASKSPTKRTPGRNEIVLPGIDSCFVRMPSEGTMSTTSGSSRDIAPVSPRRFRASFTTSKSCRGFNSKCEQDAKEANVTERNSTNEQVDIILPILAAPNDSRDYSDSPHLSPRKAMLSLRTSNSCRQFFIDDESIGNDSAPVSPRRTPQSPMRVVRDPKSKKSFRRADESKGSRLSPQRAWNLLKKGQSPSSKTFD